jgi:hypothetical protein
MNIQRPPLPQSGLEESAFESLQRLFEEAVTDSMEHGRVCAKLLLGLYNGLRFPFDLSGLRTLPHELLRDAMTVIEFDATAARREIHTYFADGSSRFEELADNYRVVDIQRLKTSSNAAPAGAGPLRPGEHVSAAVVTVANAPGYRDVRLTLDCLRVDGDEPDAVRLDVSLSTDDALSVAQQVYAAHARTWASGRAPIDVKPDETRPYWLDIAPSRLIP